MYTFQPPHFRSQDIYVDLDNRAPSLKKSCSTQLSMSKKSSSLGLSEPEKKKKRTEFLDIFILMSI